MNQTEILERFADAQGALERLRRTLLSTPVAPIGPPTSPGLPKLSDPDWPTAPREDVDPEFAGRLLLADLHADLRRRAALLLTSRDLKLDPATAYFLSLRANLEAWTPSRWLPGELRPRQPFDVVIFDRWLEFDPDFQRTLTHVLGLAVRDVEVHVNLVPWTAADGAFLPDQKEHVQLFDVIEGDRPRASPVRLRTTTPLADVERAFRAAGLAPTRRSLRQRPLAPYVRARLRPELLMAAAVISIQWCFQRC